MDVLRVLFGFLSSGYLGVEQHPLARRFNRLLTGVFNACNELYIQLYTRREAPRRCRHVGHGCGRGGARSRMTPAETGMVFS